MQSLQRLRTSCSNEKAQAALKVLRAAAGNWPQLVKLDLYCSGMFKDPGDQITAAKMLNKAVVALVKARLNRQISSSARAGQPGAAPTLAARIKRVPRLIVTIAGGDNKDKFGR